MTWQTDLYDSMLADIYTLTNREDLEGETKIALRTATFSAHASDAYFRDCVSTAVQLPNLAAIASFNISTLFPNFRGLSRVRATDINGNLIPTDRVRQLEVVELGDIYDPEYGTLKNNIVYVNGDSITVRTPLNYGGVVFEWFRGPLLRREQYDSWIAQMAPDIIVYWAAALVFQTNGNDEKAKQYMAQIQNLYLPQLRQNFLLGVMR